jgi:hypothetical protein
MITLLSAIVGFFSAAFPDLLKLFRDTQDRKHEIKILEMQIEQQQLGHQGRLEEIRLNSEVSESQALYKTYATNITWIDAFNGTVRPTIAYSFFLLYTGIKVMPLFYDLPWTGWSEEDQAIFASIISFYFGQRAMSKMRGSL